VQVPTGLFGSQLYLATFKANFSTPAVNVPKTFTTIGGKKYFRYG
jgi:hypothetical protein